MKMKKVFAVGLIAALALTALAGCGDKGDSADGGTGSELTGNVVIAGSTSVQPLTDELAAAFMDKNPGVKVDSQGGGSGQGIKAIADQIADFGALSREVKSEEEATAKDQYIIAQDGVVVIVNKDCKVTNLTLDQIQKIYTGQISNWKEVGGDDAPITVVTREEGSGTRGAFTEITKVLSKDAAGNEVDQTVKTALVQGSTGAVKTTVSSTPNTIGYISLGSLDDTIKAVDVEGVTPSDEAVLDGTYKISRPFIYVAGGELSEAAQAFVDFVLSPEGQTIVSDGYIPVAATE